MVWVDRRELGIGHPRGAPRLDKCFWDGQLAGLVNREAKRSVKSTKDSKLRAHCLVFAIALSHRPPLLVILVPRMSLIPRYDSDCPC